MSKSERSGFSFELSESQPPVEVRDRTPLGDLDLDLKAFGSSETDEPVLHFGEPPDGAPHDATSRYPGVPVSPFSPLPAPTTPAGVQQATNDVSPKGAPVSRAPQGALGIETPLDAGLSLEPIATEPAPPSSPTVPEAPAGTEDVATTRGTSAAPPEERPRIKKIQFPAAGAGGRTGPKKSKRRAALAKSEVEHQGSVSKPASRTRFAPSISTRPVRPNSDPPPSDSPDRAEADASDAHSPMDEPCDLPSPDAPLVDTTNDWGSETPSAREIWENARRVWKTTRKRARRFGGQGLRAGSALAKSVNERVQAGIQHAATRRSTEDPSARGAAFDSPSGEPTSCPKPEVVGNGEVGEGTGSPSPASRMILGLAQSAGKKVAAPLSAACAAGLFYFAGTHFLGVDGRVALSRAVQAPEVPDLGTLEEPSSANTPRGDEDANPESPSSKMPAKGSSKKEEMAVEVTPMPKGLSWPGKGLIEVVTTDDELIYVDDVFTGRGPLRRVPVSPGTHEIKIKSGSGTRSGTVDVSADKSTRAVFKSEL